MDHSHISWKWDKIRWLCNMLHDILLKIHENKKPMTCTILKLCNKYKENIQVGYLEKILLKP